MRLVTRWCRLICGLFVRCKPLSFCLCRLLTNTEAKKEADPYDVLGVEPAATSGQIKKQYWRLSLLIHPDKCSHPRANDAFQAVSKVSKELQVTTLSFCTKRSNNPHALYTLPADVVHELVHESIGRRPLRYTRSAYYWYVHTSINLVYVPNYAKKCLTVNHITSLLNHCLVFGIFLT